MKGLSILDQHINTTLAQRLTIQVISAEPQHGLTEFFGGERNCLLKKQVRRVFLLPYLKIVSIFIQKPCKEGRVCEFWALRAVFRCVS